MAGVFLPKVLQSGQELNTGRDGRTHQIVQARGQGGSLKFRGVMQSSSLESEFRNLN